MMANVRSTSHHRIINLPILRKKTTDFNDKNNCTGSESRTVTNTSSSSSEDSILTSIYTPFTNESSINSPTYTKYTESKYSFRSRPTSTIAKSSVVITDSSLLRHDVRPTASKDCSLFKQESLRSFGSSKEYNKKAVLIRDAIYALNALLYDLQKLWANSLKKTSVSTLRPLARDEDRLLELIGLCSFVVHEMGGEWESFTLSHPDKAKFDELTGTNLILCNLLEQAKSSHISLQSELLHLQKEKILMNTEVKELSLKLALVSQQAKNVDTSAQQALRKHSVSNGSQQFNCPTSSETGNYLMKKREDEFNALMDVVLARRTDMADYQSQLEQYAIEITSLQTEIKDSKAMVAGAERVNLTLIEGNKEISRERDHYEAMLKLILQENENNGSSLEDFLQQLISKLNSLATEGNGRPNATKELIEGALQATQEQNLNYRNEIQLLKETIATLSSNLAEEEETKLSSAEEYSKLLEEKNEELSLIEESHNEKYSQLEEMYDALTQSKETLNNELTMKKGELEVAKYELRTLNKKSFRQKKKFQDLQTRNFFLERESVEYNNNMEALNTMVNRLRSDLREKSAQLNGKLRACGEETSELKEHCKCLNSRLQQLTTELMNAEEKIKGQEHEKEGLEKHNKDAEEERKIVDRRLTELRLELQTDSVLRAALMERNDALQREISRLCRVKMFSLDMNVNTHDLPAYFDVPPSEMSMTQALCQIQTKLPSFLMDKKYDAKEPRNTTSA